MATLSPTPSLHPIRFASSSSSSSSSSLSSSSSPLAFCTFPLQTPKSSVSLKAQTIKNRRVCVTKAVEEETQQVQQQEAEQQQQQQPAVVVPVSPSDTLTMFFQAEGTMSEAAIPTLTKALEDIEGVGILKVQVVEGLASVELKKQTTVQATGVASSLLETIQGSGFKLQTLNLSFDEEDNAAE